MTNWFSANRGRFLMGQLARDLTPETLVLAPDYYCAEALGEIQKTKSVFFYRVDQNLEPQLDSVAELLDSKTSKLFILCHFFGRRRGQKVIPQLQSTANIFILHDETHREPELETTASKNTARLITPYKWFGQNSGAFLNSELKIETAQGPTAPLAHLAKNRIRSLLPQALKTQISLWRNSEPLLFSEDPPDQEFNLESLTKSQIQTLTNKEKIRLMSRVRQVNRSLWISFASQHLPNLKIDSLIDDHPFALRLVGENLGSTYKTLQRLTPYVYTWPRLPKDLPANSIAKNIRDTSLLIGLQSPPPRSFSA
jgi:hypothetical protein